MEYATRYFRSRFVTGLLKCSDRDLNLSLHQGSECQRIKEGGLKLFAHERGYSLSVSLPFFVYPFFQGMNITSSIRIMTVSTMAEICIDSMSHFYIYIVLTTSIVKLSVMLLFYLLSYYVWPILRVYTYYQFRL